MPQYISQEQAKKLIEESNGYIFGLTFIKRSSQEKRIMTARTGIHKWLKNGELKYNPEIYNLIVVGDMNIKQYRIIPLDGIIKLRINGKKFRVKNC